MLISTEILSAARLVGEERAVELCARAGFDAWDLSILYMSRFDKVTGKQLYTDHPLAGPEYLHFVRQLKQVGLDNGIHCNQSHAPFPVANPAVRASLKRAIECTAEAGGEICIIHPGNNMSLEENTELYLELLPFAKEHGIKIAAENMFNWDKEKDCALFAACSTPDSFSAHLAAVNDPSVVACLDVGHAEMMGDAASAVAMIEMLGSRLQALHLHDNDRRHDRHQIPFSMDIDFVPIIRALKKIGYQGYFTLEAVNYLDGFTPETAFEGLCQLAAAARRLADMFESA